MKIGFIDFWDGFDVKNNFFTHTLSLIYDNVIVTSPEDCDFLFFSCFGNMNSLNHYKKRNKKIIFYTGENLRRNEYLHKLNLMSDCDICLSFDLDEDDKKIRLPLWILQIDWFGKVNYSNPAFTIHPDRISNNIYYNKIKNKFCSIVYNGQSSHRLEAISELSKYKMVDVYGNKYGNIGNGEDKKLDIISEYKFNLCFENSIFPGYYTEKPLHAKIAGCVPIYWSDKNMSVDFNHKAFINLSDFSNIRDMVDFIIEIDKDDSKLEKIKNEKLFIEESHRVLFENIVSKFKNKIDNLR